MRFGDVRKLLDATYRAPTEDRLVASVARAAEDEIGVGVCVVSYDVDPETGVIRTRSVGSRGFSRRLERAYVDVFESLPGGFVKESLEVLATTRSRNTVTVPAEVDAFIKRAKVADILTVNGWDGAGRGVLLTANLPSKVKLAAPEEAMWTRVAAHLVATVRLLQHEERPAAILSRDASVLEVDRNLDAPLDEVRATAKAIEHVRRSQPPAARTGLGRVPPRVAAEWTLVSRFVDEGQEHIILRRNPAPAPGTSLLSPRERQVLALLDAGHHMKLVAYELGISYATVRVLAARARRKRDT